MLPSDLPTPYPSSSPSEPSSLPPPLPPASPSQGGPLPEIPIQPPASSPSFLEKNKKLFIMLGLLLFVFAGGGYAGMKFLIQKPAPKEAEKPQVPAVFVAEQVTSAEKKDLTSFFAVWRDFQARKGSFADAEKLALNEGGRFENVAVLKIGNETLYGNDLNYLFLFYNFQDYTTAAQIPEEKLNEVVNQAISDSTIIQEAIKQNLITSTPDFFNTANKNYTLRNEMMAKAKEALSEKFVQKISGESISIWFNNDIVPVSTESGKKLALAKLQNLQQKLKSGQMTMAQAGEAIKNDAEIGQKIDPAYKNNAYSAFTSVENGQGPFTMDNLNQAAWSLGEGQISDVIIGKAPDSRSQLVEQLYMVIKINQRTGEAKAPTTDQLIENFVKEIPKQNLGL